MEMDGYRQVVQEYLDRVWGAHDLDALDELLTPDFRRHISPAREPLTVHGQRERLATMQSAFPNAEIELQHVVGNGDLVAFHSVMRGTHAGSEFRGLEASGQRFEVDLVDMLRLRAGRIVEHWGGPDLLDLLTQLGARIS
jgi:predicted ester cyclase